MTDEIKWECPRCEKINTSEWANAMVEYERCEHCNTLCDVHITVVLEGVEVIE